MNKPSDSEIPTTAPAPRKDSFRKRFLFALALAGLLHVPATPAMVFVHLSKTFAALQDPAKTDYKNTEFTVPVELLEGPKTKAAAEDKANTFSMPAAPPPAEAAKPSADGKSKGEAKDKKAQDIRFAKSTEGGGKGKTNAPTGPGDQKTADKSQSPAAPAVASASVAPPDEKAPKVVGLEGDLHDGVVGKPNVTIAMWFPTMKSHALGEAVSKIMGCQSDWRVFMRAGVDPMQDLDGVMIVGPQMQDTSKMTAAVQHHISPDRVHSVMESLVQRSQAPGRWVKPQVAQVTIQRKQRMLFPHPKDVIFVAPSEGWEKLDELKAEVSLPLPRGRAFALTLQKPSIPLHRLGLEIPERITKMTLDIYPRIDGSVEFLISFEDVNDRASLSDSRRVQEQFQRLSDQIEQLSHSISSLSAIVPGLPDRKNVSVKLPPIGFVAESKRFSAEITFTPEQAASLLGIIGSGFCQRPDGAPQGSSSGILAVPAAPNSATSL